MLHARAALLSRRKQNFHLHCAEPPGAAVAPDTADVSPKGPALPPGLRDAPAAAPEAESSSCQRRASGFQPPGSEGPEPWTPGV